MKNILVINLKRFGDIFSSGHLISSLRAEHRNASISILVFDEFKAAAKRLANIDNIYTLARKEILGMHANPIFSSGFALDQFLASLEDVKKCQWDLVINFSNDYLSSLVTSYFSSTRFAGIRFNNRLSVEHSNDWALIFNDVITSSTTSPFHFMDVYHQIAELPRRKGAAILYNSEYDNEVSKNLKLIRDHYTTDKIVPKIVGIQLFSSDKKKDIPLVTMCRFLELIWDSPRYVPVLLIAPTSSERDLAKKYSEYLGEEINTIEADFEALPSVLKHIDMLITPDTVTVHVADLTETPMIQISLGSSPFTKQGTQSVGNLILSTTESCRPCSQKKPCPTEKNYVCQNHLSPEDILNTLDYSFSQRKKAPLLSPQVSLFETSEDQYGLTYELKSGDVDYFKEISRILTRYFLVGLTGKDVTLDLQRITQKFSKSYFQKWINKEQNSLVSASRLLLNLVRIIKGVNLENKSSINKFVQALDDLLAFCEFDTFVTIPILMYRAKIESIDSKSFEKTLPLVEKETFELRRLIQGQIEMLRSLQDEVRYKDMASQAPQTKERTL